MPELILITGLPRAGKSSLCDAIEEDLPGFTHVPLDRYVRPLPENIDFLHWISQPDCIAWDVLQEHLGILRSGACCYSPRPNWENGWKDWICSGGRMPKGPGRRMEPASKGYLVPGTHAFAMAVSGLRVFVEAPYVVIAERLTGKPADSEVAEAIVRKLLAPNFDAIMGQRRNAHITIDGSASRIEQVGRFAAHLSDAVNIRNPSIQLPVLPIISLQADRER